MNKHLSSKIKIISFISIILVVFVHCYNYKDNFLQTTTIITEGLNYGTFIEYFICNGFGRFAVPIFFMISGYLMFLSYKLSINGYLSKIKSRFVSLAIPYILWTLISMGVCLIFWKVDIMPVNDLKNNINTGGFIKAFLTPPNFQFWFVKQLIIYVVISPIIYLLIKFRITRIVYFLAICGLWCIDRGAIFNNQIVIEALCFYSLGAYLSITNKEEVILKEKKKSIVIATLIMWITALVIKTILCGTMSVEDSNTIILVLYKVSVILGIFTMWFGLDFVMKNDNFKNKLLNLSPHTFFVFCFHEPLLDFVIQYSLINISDSVAFNTITFFIYPTVAIILSITVSTVLVKYVPFLHNLLTGSRGTRKINIDSNETRYIEVA